jgi:hypothetical protein
VHSRGVLELVVLAALMSTGPSPTPGPTPSPSPAPLHVIAHVVSTSACSAIVAHANNAIGSAISGDVTMVATIRSLRATRLTGNPIQRRNTLTALGNLAISLDESAVSGSSEVKRLRALAEKSTDAVRKKELKAFADALGGALWRQHKVARDLNGFLDSMDAKDMMTNDEAQNGMNDALFGPTPSPNPFGPAVGPPDGPIAHQIDPPTDDTAAGQAADDFLGRIPDIVTDERTANSHIPGAIAGC